MSAALAISHELWSGPEPDATGRLTAREAAGRLGVTPERVRQLVASGELAAVRTPFRGRAPSIYILPEDLERFVAQRRARRAERVASAIRGVLAAPGRESV